MRGLDDLTIEDLVALLDYYETKERNLREYLTDNYTFKSEIPETERVKLKSLSKKIKKIKNEIESVLEE